MRRHLDALCVTAGTLVVAIPSILLSKTFQLCVASIPTYEIYYRGAPSSSYFLFSLFSKFECVGPFIDVNANGIIAVFTIALTISTILMWWGAKQAAIGAEAQAKENKRAIDAFEKSARAAEMSAQAAMAQNADMKASIEVARKAATAAELSATASVGVNLPILHIEEVSSVTPLTDAADIGAWLNKFQPRIRIKNYGSTPAIITRVVTNVFVGPDLPKGDPVYTYHEKFPDETVLDKGATGTFTNYLFDTAKELTPEIKEKILAFNKSDWFHFYGFIDYKDFLGNPHTIGFAYYLVNARKFTSDPNESAYQFRR